MRDNNIRANNHVEETSSFSTKWTLNNWLLVLSGESSEAAMKETADGIAKVQKGKAVVYEIVTDCWLFGRLHNRPGFKNGESVLTSRISRMECIDNVLYAITKSGSCYRLEGSIDGIGVKDRNGSIIVEKVENGKTIRYEL